jgi:zinc transporter 2
MMTSQKDINLSHIQLNAALNDLKMVQGVTLEVPSLTSITEDDQPLYYCDRTVSRTRAETKAQTSNKAFKVLVLVSILTVIFIIAELAGGIIANSLAIMTDAFHMISDLASFMISMMAIVLARREPTKRYSYGYQRAEVLGALTSIVLIWILTGGLVYVAIERIVHEDYDVDPDIMMITAGVGVCFNIIMGLVLHFGKAGHSHFGVPHNHDHDHGHGHSHGHGHGHSHKHEIKHDHKHHGHGHTNHGADIESQNGDCHSHASHDEHTHDHDHQENLNIRAAFVHVLGDLVQSIGVLIAAIVIKFTGFEIADPICTFLFSILVLLTTYGVMRDTVRVLMECAPTHLNVDEVRRDLLSIAGVVDVHSLRLWSVKMDTFAVSVHIDTVKNADVSAVVFDAHQILQNRYNIEYVTVQAQCTSPPSRRSPSVVSTTFEESADEERLAPLQTVELN